MTLVAHPLRMASAVYRFFCVVVAAALLAPPPQAHACGWLPFSDRAGPRGEALQHLLTDRRLPILSPGWHSEYWVIAWARLRGKSFDAAERAALEADPHWLRLSPGPAVGNALDDWMAARAAHGFVDSPPSPWRRGDGYDHVLVCGPDAFGTAAETLRDRATALSDAELRAWISTQDQVFARCADPDAPLPEPLPQSAHALARHDRAYQIAAATALGQRPADAEPLFRAIAESGSPWADVSRYREALSRYRRRDITGDELRAGLALVADSKAKRGFQQLLDRLELFAHDPADIVETLAERLMTESLGGDLPRVLRDIVHFAKRVPHDECTSDLVALIAAREPCAGEDRRLVALRAPSASEPVPAVALPGGLLELNRRFRDARRALVAGEEAVARREAAALVRLARGSTRATQNAAATVALAVSRSRDELLRHAFRWRDGEERATDPALRVPSRTALHADGRAALAQLSMADWRRLMVRVPDELKHRLAQEGLIRATILGEMDEARRFARSIVDAAPDDDALAKDLREALEGARAQLRFALTMILLEHDPVDLSITDELALHYASSQIYGCSFGRCGDDDPSQTPLSLVTGAPPERLTSEERRRLIRHGPRINALGDLVLGLAQSHRGDARTPELLHRFVQRTRRASLHRGTDPRTGILSRRAYVVLHERFGDTPWAERTRYWYQ